MQPRLAASLAENPRSACRVDWVSREGVVHHMNGHAVFIIWDGVKRQDQLPIKGVEKVS